MGGILNGVGKVRELHDGLGKVGLWEGLRSGLGRVNCMMDWRR